MEPDENAPEPEKVDPDDFPTTSWSTVRRVQNRDGAVPEEVSAEALDRLCEGYWRPVYAFLTQSGKKPEEAKDLTQSFFGHLLSSNLLHRAEQERGKLRSFLLGALKRFVRGEHRRESASKRGGGHEFVSYEEAFFGEEPFHLEPAAEPGEAFDRAWALEVVARSVAALRERYARKDRSQLLETLLPYIERADGESTLAELAHRQGISIQAARVHLHRVRKRLRNCIFDELTRALVPEDELDAELRYLCGLLEE
ncbi:MAG: sigma-70 family RNA polymerase sigma factor [Akkermansiaceae bacterium]|nr:sigma-70 family RNA polymerase sigma factor [Akkermansiaceae bacterium]